MPVSTSPMMIEVAPWVTAQAGSMSMLETTLTAVSVLRPVLGSTTGAMSVKGGVRRYHCPVAGPLGATVVDRLSG